MGVIMLPVFITFLFYVMGYLSEGHLAIRMPICDYIFLGAALGLLSVMGDLCESFLKRCANVKDSGVIFQSHGGALDRLDSLVLSAPFLYWYAH